MSAPARFGAALYGAAWEVRRRAYAAGLARPRGVRARVVSVGNVTVGGAGKTTLVTHLAKRAIERGVRVAVVARRYRPGPDGLGDEELLYRNALGAARVFAGRHKWRLAEAAAAAGAELVLIDDGFSHWRLARDIDLLLVDASDPWGGGALLPAGRLREPFRAVQRADAVIVTRVADREDAAQIVARAAVLAPAALLATARHAPVGVRELDGRASSPGSVRVVTATGNPQAVERTASEMGFSVTGRSFYRDHHWFSEDECRHERDAARRAGAVVLLTAKDAVRWRGVGDDVCVMDVAWAWQSNGDAIEHLVFEGSRSETGAVLPRNT